MKTQYFAMSDDELKQVLSKRDQDQTMFSMLPRKYHGPELKCGGPSMCSDCRDRVKNGIGFDDWYADDVKKNEDLLQKIINENKDEASNSSQDSDKEKPKPCTCSARELYWHGCRCKDPERKSKFQGIKT